MVKDRVTIKDVARVAEVTAQTVSRVFRNKGYVAGETRRKVLQAAKQLKYVPNNDAIALRMGAPKNIAVVFDSLINLYFSVMVDYLYREVEKRGYKLLTVLVSDHRITEEIYLSTLSMGVRGVISFLEPEEGLGSTVRSHGIPLLILGRRTDDTALDYITTDDEQGGRLAAERLLEAGCQRPVYVAEGIGISCVQDRYQGFADVVKLAGLEPCIIDVTDGLRTAMDDLVTQNGVPDGLFCFNDMIAFRAIDYAGRHGYKDMKIIGYDNIRAEIAFPLRLASVGTDKGDFVAFVVDRLLSKLDKSSDDGVRISEQVSVSMYGDDLVWEKGRQHA